MSAAFVRFVGDLTQAPASERIYYIDNQLRRPPPCASTLLDQAVHAASLKPLLHGFREPNAIAGALRPQLATERDPRRRHLLADDLALARSIGSPPRFVLVDTAGQRLWMFDRGSAASMKVVVGKSGMDTPPMAGLIRFAVVNPYWDIPPDVVRNEVAPRIHASGATAYLAAHDYEAVSSYDDSAVPVDAAAVDWSAVRAGSRNIGVRQLPGPENMMGRVMFMFPNKYGIYLHDTPARWVFSRSDRRLSHGCVRLERAADLYSWLFRRALTDDENTGAAARENLSRPVPVYILPLRSAAWKG